jgi:oligosaccharyltransferase complex subunit beta
VKEVTEWVLNERDVLRAVSKRHHRKGESLPQQQYKIKDQIHYEITIEEYQNDRWRPFIADDMQLELIMLNPYSRTSLQCHNGTFMADLQLPDRLGVFTFKVDYYRHGYSYLHELDVVPIRHFRHDEYERFLLAAYPYYFSSFSMMIGLFLFSWIFLYHRDTSASKSKAK